MNIIYNPPKTPSKYKKLSEKSFTINELKDIVGGEVSVMYLPKENAYIVYNKVSSTKRINSFNKDATDILRNNYADSKVKIHGKALLTDEI